MTGGKARSIQHWDLDTVEGTQGVLADDILVAVGARRRGNVRVGC